MDKGTKTPIPKCRLYLVIFVKGGEAILNVVNLGGGKREGRGATVHK